MQSFALKAKKTIKKVAALGTGIAMMGATLTSALAVSINLDDYPSSFKDATVVVGTAAAGADDVAAADIAADLPVTSAVTTISGDSYMVEKGGDKFNLNEDSGAGLKGVDASITDNELDLLADQTYVDGEGTNTGEYDYTQTIDLGNATMVWKFDRDTSGDREGDPAGDYLYLSANTYAWNYSLKITGSAVQVKDAADIENTVLNILGRDWTIVDASFNQTSYGTVDKLTLLAGDVTATLTQGSTKGGVTIVDVDESESKCIIEYGGKTYQIDKGQTKTMSDGTIIGITDVTAVHETGAGQDMCEVNIGAHKVVLEDGKKVEVNNEDVDGTEVFISGSSTADTVGLKYITVSYTPDDNTWLEKGESLEDPVFGAFKVVFNDIIETNEEEIKLDIASDKIYLTAKNQDGDLLDNEVICFLNATDQFERGKDRKHLMAVFNNENITNNSIGTDGGVTPKNMKGTRFLMSFDGISHIVEITDIDTTQNQTSFEFLDTGEVYSDLDYTDGTTTVFSDIHSNLILGYNINLDAGAAATYANINFTQINNRGPSWYTLNEGNITFLNHTGGVGVEGTYRANIGGQAYTGCDMLFGEIDAGAESEINLYEGGSDAINISFKYDSGDNEIEWNRTGSNILGAELSLEQKDDDSSYNYMGRTPYGTYVEAYTKDDGDLTIWYPEEAAYADVRFAASEAVSGGSMGSVTPVLESEVSNVAAQDVILVGGPCANGLTAQVMGVSDKTMPGCAEGFMAGKAMLKLMDNGNKVALIVAGYNAQDTKMAAVALGGNLPAKKEATVSGNSLELSEITVA